MSTPSFLTTFPPLDGKSAFLASGWQCYKARQSPCQDKVVRCYLHSGPRGMLQGCVQTPSASFRCQRQGAGRSSPELQSVCPKSLQCYAAGWKMLPWTPLDHSVHLHHIPNESILDRLLRHSCFPSEIAFGMTARQPNSERKLSLHGKVAQLRR